MMIPNTVPSRPMYGALEPKEDITLMLFVKSISKASFVVYVSPSAIAGILAALSYILALQIKRVRDRVNVEIDELSPKSTDLALVFDQSMLRRSKDEHDHEH